MEWNGSSEQESARTVVRLRQAVAYCLAYELREKGLDPLELRQRASTYSPSSLVLTKLSDQILYYADLAVSTPLSVERRTQFAQHPLHSAWKQMGFDGPEVIALVYGGATKIKGYVFESARLPEVRGASALFDRINLRDVPALWGESNEMAGIIQAKLPCPECVIYASGGNFLAFAPPSLAAELADAVEQRYTSETLVGNSAVVWNAFSLLELQYGHRPDAYWVDDYERDLKSDLRSILESYYDYPQELGPKAPRERFLQRKTFGELVTVLAGKMMHRRGGWGDREGRQRRYIPHYDLLPYAVKCHSCDVRPAVVAFRAEDSPPGGSPRVYCEACARKRVTGQFAKQDDNVSNTQWFSQAFPSWKPEPIRSWEGEFQTFLNQHPESQDHYVAGVNGNPHWRGLDRVQPANDLREIAHGSTPDRYIGLIYADGNNVGARVASLQTPVDYRRFAQDLSEVAQQAVFGALAEHLSPVWISMTLDAERPNRAHIWTHPFEIITIGGDDLILIVPGSKALEIARSIGIRFEKMLGKPLQRDRGLYEGQRYRQYVLGEQGLSQSLRQWEYEPTISLSAGVVIAHEATPIFFLQHLAEELLKSAKKWRKDQGYKAGTVDFVALKSLGMVASRLSEFRARAYDLDDRQLTARPYTWIELDGLLDTARTIRYGGGLARSQVYQLQNALVRGRQSASIDYLYTFSRLNAAQRGALARTLNLAWHDKDDVPPWHGQSDGHKVETIWRDLVEIYDFVEQEPAKAEEVR